MASSPAAAYFPGTPAALEDISAEWLSDALSRKYPGTRVTLVTVGRAIQRFATNARLMLEYDATGHEHRLPPTMFVKSDFSPEGGKAAVAAPAAREVRYYTDVAEHVPLTQPACYFAQTDLGGRSILLLEDLLGRNVTFGEATAPLYPAQVASGLSQLATLHAHWWDAPQLDTTDTYPGTLRPVVLGLLSDEAWPVALARPSGHWIPGALHSPATMRAATVAMWEAAAALPPCLIHGDPHLGNSYREPDGALGFLDWQATSRGSWCYDVTRYLIGSLEIENRREHESELITGYLAELAQRGVPAPTFEEAWLAYRQNALHGLRFLCSPPGNYPDSHIEAYVSRFATAADDLDALGSLSLT